MRYYAEPRYKRSLKKLEIMFSKAYHFLINSFLVVTQNSYKKALSLGMDHLAKLLANQADPVILAIHAAFEPVMQSFLAAQQNLDAALGDYKGETQTVEELFEQLNDEKLPYWEGQVFYYYPKGSAQATQLMPHGRGDFQTGTYEQRILAIKTFGDKCALINDLVPLSVNVLAFHTEISSARALQQSAGEGQVAALRDLRETARISLCVEMYGNMGQLMHHYRTNPLEVERYYDFTLLRTKSESAPQVSVARGTVTNAQTSAAVPNATVEFIIDGEETITVQTDDNGAFEVELGTFTQETAIDLQVNLDTYLPFSEEGVIEPNESIDLDIQLIPAAPSNQPTS